jgi:hypothetical protein
LEETYATAVHAYKYGHGSPGDHDYVRIGNKAACARLAECDPSTFDKILHRYDQGISLVGSSLVETDGQPFICSVRVDLLLVCFLS